MHSSPERSTERFMRILDLVALADITMLIIALAAFAASVLPR